jgi:DNA mismatch repair protein MutS2
MHENIHNNSQVLQQIEWDTLISRLSDRCYFKSTSNNITQYLDSVNDVNSKINKTKYFDQIHYDLEYKSLINDIYLLQPDAHYLKHIDLLNKNGTLNLTDTNSLVLTVEFFLNQFKALERYGLTNFSKENLNLFKQKITKSILKEFRQFVSTDGEIDFSKHPLLRSLFHEQLKLESVIRHKLNEALRSSELKHKIQFSSHDLINDRYVIPIKSDSFQNKIGHIIARSDSGNTLFVEPKSISGLNYQRIEILVQIQNIISTLEINLSAALGEFTNELKMITNHLFYIDEFNSRLIFAKDLKLSEPILTKERNLKLLNFFHPLIENPVKNDIEISHTKHGMIISGPNTGGKTATLKAIALTQMLLRYGLFIPCDYGEVYLYDKIFYFGNDQQNLNEGLSSFSAEVQNYSKLISNLGNTNLILIDEIFNSTSSEEASALAVSLFKSLATISENHIIVSSHHQTLKTFLHQDDNFISAHVGYDVELNKPTYKLYFGTPGSSQALNIFKSLNQNNALFIDIYNNSLQFLDNKIIHYEKLLESLSVKENELNKTLQSNKEISSQLKNQKKSMEGVIKLKIDERVKQTQNKLDKVIKKAENLVLEVKSGEITKSKNLYNKAHKIKSELSELIPPREGPIHTKDFSNLYIPEKVEVSKSYFCLKLNKTVIVKKIMKKDVSVQTGNFTLKVPTSSLRIANKPKQQIHTQEISTVSRTRDTQLEYDCRGMRLDEFQSLVELAVSDLMLANAPFVNFIHGHGTGVLKKWIRSYAKNNKNIIVDSNDTGNDGETRIILI